METQIASVTVWDRIKGGLYNIFRGKKARRNIIVILMFLAALGYITYAYLGPTTETTYEYATAVKKDIKKTVEGSGKVVSVSELDIQQLSGGKVTSVLVKPGDYVKKDQVIATLDNRQAAIQLAQAKASYDKVINGGNTQEDLAIAKQSVINAKQSYDIVVQQQDTTVANAKRTLLNTSIAAVPVYDSRVQENIPTITGSYTCNEEVEYDIKYASNDIVSVNTGNGQIRLTSVPQPLGDCGLFISFDVSESYANGQWKVILPNKQASSYSSNLNAYNNAIQAKEIALQNANTSVINAELAYNQKIAPPTASDLASAEASWQNAQLTYENTIIRAPFDGQIGSVSAAVGQQTSTQTGVATIITKDKIAEISLNEIDIVNVKLGQPVELTFDAIPGETFEGSVAEINTIGIASSNVVSFAVKISIPNADDRVKSGMSVTANIIVENKAQVLTVPASTIKTEGDRSYVMKKIGGSVPTFERNIGSTTASTTGFGGFRNGSTTGSTTRQLARGATAQAGENQKVYVTVGITNEVDTEIIEGLSEGDMVVSKTNTGTAAATTASGGFSLFGSGPRTTTTGGGANSRTGGGGNATFVR